MALQKKDYLRITIGIAAIVFGIWKLMGVYKANKAKDENSIADDVLNKQQDSTYQE